METKQAYDSWASQYDYNENKTRDLEGRAIRKVLATISFNNCLEIGCGTGKNTEWLITKAKVTGVDLSNEMLTKAKLKITSEKVTFLQADITKDWTFKTELYDMITFCLVLEHIFDLEKIFKKASACLKTGGHIYVGELHPFKQYSGSKARFETEKGVQIVQCYNHHITDFVSAAKNNGLALIDINEFFYDDDKAAIPRILTLVFKKL